MLLRWFAAGSGRCSGYPTYEETPEHFLARLPTSAILDAMAYYDTDAAVWSGAVRYLAGFHFQRDRGEELADLPDDTRRRLLAIAMATDDEDKQGRARAAFG